MINSTSPVQLFLDLMDPDQRSISRLFRLLVTERNGIFRRCSVPFRVLVTTMYACVKIDYSTAVESNVKDNA